MPSRPWSQIATNHKLRREGFLICRNLWLSQFVTVQNTTSQIDFIVNCDNSGIPAVAICDLTQFVIKAVTAQTESNNTENVFWVLGGVPRFTFDMNMKSCFLPVLVLFHCYICWCVCISVIKLIIDVPRKPAWKGPMLSMFSELRSIPSVTMKSIWEVVFWTVTNCDSHKLRQFRNPCRRNLWFVAICDQGRGGTNWVQ